MRRLFLPLRPILAAARRRMFALRARLYCAAAGQGLVEYGLILVLIMVVCVAILGAVGNTISEVWYERLLRAIP